jgi:L-ascorbate metabolism protein UlaG (beta-lactamase superfamily)
VFAKSRFLMIVLVFFGLGTPALGAAEMMLEYIAHASFRITSPTGVQILIDPYADQVWLGYDFPQSVSADTVLISHPHYDHDGGDYRGLPTPWAADARILRFPGNFQIGDIKITGMKGRHVDPYGKEFGQFNTIWLIEVGGLRILHVGDNEPLSGETMAALDQIDILLAPMDSNQHIWSYAQLAEISARLNPHIIIPMHYRLGDLEPDADHPGGLGDIDPWLETQTNVVRLDSHQITPDQFMDGAPLILVPQHWPGLTRPN